MELPLFILPDAFTGKLPFGIYFEMEKMGMNLNEIDTTDCDMSLVSLQVRIILHLHVIRLEIMCSLKVNTKPVCIFFTERC